RWDRVEVRRVARRQRSLYSSGLDAAALGGRCGRRSSSRRGGASGSSRRTLARGGQGQTQADSQDGSGAESASRHVSPRAALGRNRALWEERVTSIMVTSWILG